MIANILKTEGIDVATAVDGTSGLAKAKSEIKMVAPDLL